MSKDLLTIASCRHLGRRLKAAPTQMQQIRGVKFKSMFSFNDNLDVVEDSPLVVLAKVALIATDEGGRHTPILGGHAFSPNHNFGDEENRNFHIGQIDFEKDDTIYPGDERTVQIRFLNVRGLRELLHNGLIWRIQEGPKLIAMGEVVEIKT